MIRGLLIRQVFVLLDIVLAVAAVVTIGLVAMDMLEPPVALPPAEVDTSNITAARSAPADVEGRPTYDAILKNGLFGDAGRFDPTVEPEPEPEPEPVDIPVEETQLNLQLIGTTASWPKDPLASAIIRNNDRKGASGTFFLEEPILEDEGEGVVKLVEVYPREVILLNERKDPAVRERLVMGEGEGKQAAATREPERQRRDSGVERVTIDRDDFSRELYENYSTLVTQIRPEYHRDENGNVIGLTAKNIEEIPLAKKLSLADGDVLQSINNEQIDSEQKVMELFQKYRNANAFRIGVLRNGKPKIITYRLE